MKNIMQQFKVWRSLKNVLSKALLGSVPVYVMESIATVYIVEARGWTWLFINLVFSVGTWGIIVAALLWISSVLLSYVVVCAWELHFGKSVSEEWIARAEGIRNRHPETGAILYFLERGDASYLAEWICSFEALKYDSDKEKLSGLLEDCERIDGLILATENSLRNTAAGLRFEPPSAEELLKVRNTVRNRVTER